MLAAGYKPGFQTRKINHSSASTLLERLRRNLNAVLRTGRTLPSGKLVLREQRRGCSASAAGTAFSGNFESYPGTLPKISGLR